MLDLMQITIARAAVRQIACEQLGSTPEQEPVRRSGQRFIAWLRHFIPRRSSRLVTTSGADLRAPTFARR